MRLPRILTCSSISLAIWLPVAAPSPAQHKVNVGPAALFHPSRLGLNPGETVTWTNRGGTHNVRADDDSFRCSNDCQANSSPSSAAWRATVKFEAEGALGYLCEQHIPLNMRGLLFVRSPGFSDGFESGNLCAWSDGKNAEPCEVATAALAAGARALHPPSGYEAAGRGDHRAVLESLDGAPLRLDLQWWDGREWQEVARGVGTSSREALSFSGRGGYYRWQVRATSVSGRYRLRVDYPALATAADGSILMAGQEASRSGEFGLISTYTDNEEPAYLVDSTAGRAESLRVVFWIRPARGFVMQQDDEHVIYAAYGKGRDEVLRLVLRGLAKRRKLLAIAEVRTVEGWQMVGSAKVKVKRWSRLQVDWTAASDEGRADGMASFAKGNAGRVSASNRVIHLENPFFIERMRLGQVKRDDPATVGQIFVDGFETWIGE